MSGTDTIIKQDPRPRRIGGALLLLIGIPLTLIAIRILMIITPTLFDVFLFSGGPFLMALGIWAIASSQHQKVRLRITDDAIALPSNGDVSIPLKALTRVRLTRPVLAKHERLSFETVNGSTDFDVIHLTAQGRDIVSMISARLENQGAYLEEGAGDITGAPNGIWDVRQGRPFA
ncbi:MAG: hypothetical protein AAFU41_11070 [Pseudomonadota bacterium]